MSDPIRFGRWLKHCRSLLSLNQQEFAQRLKYSVVTYRKVEQGQRPSLTFLEQLADYLQLAPGQRAALLEFGRTGAHPNPLALLPQIAPAAPAPPAAPPRLPAPPNRIVGRERDTEAVAALLRTPCVRLVTLLGPPGVGKTRLSLCLGEQVRADYPDGVFFVPLAPVSDPAVVLPLIAELIGATEQRQEPLDATLASALHGRRTLLILDNIEQVLAAAPQVAALLERCPQLTILTTSRAPLNIRAEWQYQVAPLALPHPDHLADLAALAAVPSVMLFVDRAQAINAAFRLTPENSAAVAAICVRMDGLPLGIELVTKRSRLLTPQALLSQLDRRLALHSHGPTDLPPRQQTLHNAISWSYDLLERAEQVVFARLAVFVGGCSVAAACAVCGDGARPALAAEDQLDPQTIRSLEALVNKSLLSQQSLGDGAARLMMLETIREYALERLRAEQALGALQRRHGDYYLALVESVESDLVGPQQARWLQQLSHEHANIRAALQWALAAEQTEAALRLAGALYFFWFTLGHLSEGRRWLEAGLGRTGDLEPADEPPAAAPQAGGAAPHVRAKALYVLAMLVNEQGDYALAQRCFQRSLAIYRALGDRAGVARVLTDLSLLFDSLDDQEQKRAHLEECLAIYQELRDQRGVARVLFCQAGLEPRDGDMDDLKLLGQSLRIYQSLGDWRGSALLLNRIGNLYRKRGDYAQAQRYLSECLALRSGLDDPRGQGIAYAEMGLLALLQHDHDRAGALYAEGLALFYALAHRLGLATCIAGLAAAALGDQTAVQAERAALLCGAADRILGDLGAELFPEHQAAYQRTCALVAARLGDAAFQRHRSVGRAVALDLVVASLRSWGAAGASPAPPALERALGA